MSELSHRVRIFVYRLGEGAPSYLLMRSAQGIESLWTPLHGSILFDEQMEGAIEREVRNDTGIIRPETLIDLQMPSHLVLGDEEIIEWCFGFHTSIEGESIEIDEGRWAAFQWIRFADAYTTLEMEHDRAAILRLHTLLHAA
jgi:hypothetical protein